MARLVTYSSADWYRKGGGMLVDVEQFVTDKVVGWLFAGLFVATLATGLLAWNQARAERFLHRRRLPVADKTVMAVQGPLTYYRFTLLAVLVPAVLGVPYITGVAYVTPLVVDRLRRRRRLGGVEPTPPYGGTRLLLDVTMAAVLIAAAGSGYLAGALRGHTATVACWFAGLGVLGVVIANIAARIRYPIPEPADVPMSVVATVDRRLRWAAVGGGLYLALLGAGKAAQTGGESLVEVWRWRGTTIEALELAATVLGAIAVVILFVTAFVLPATDGARD